MPEQCNAHIPTLGVTCCRDVGEDHGTMSDEPHFDSYSEIARSLAWTHDAPGAVPHTQRRYRAYDSDEGSWSVAADPQAKPVVAVFWRHHPDAEGAARAEADRLNGTAADLVDVGDLLRDRDEAVADWKQAVLAQQEACRERDDATTEAKRYAARADRYRDALKVVAGLPVFGSCVPCERAAMVARAALRERFPVTDNPA